MTACSDASAALAEPVAATAPVAAWWLVLEQSGPWGAKALTQSHLDPELGAQLDDAAGAHGGRVALVRRPRRHADTGGPVSHRVWLAWTRPGATRLLGGWTAEPAALGALPWRAVEEGDHESVLAHLPFLRAESHPLLLVCTNGRRDVCCATKGRQLVQQLRDRVVGRVWETTHLGGHRFAPTTALLPHGVVHGRLDAGTAERVVSHARAGRLLPDGYRGRSTYSRPGQAAEAEVRRVTGAAGLDDLAVDRVDALDSATWQATVSHRGGGRWSVSVRATTLEPARPESCGKDAARPVSYRAEVTTTEP
ncbi:hypothetical protein CLV30_107167 [Haloactinopolyspora alba]|uniref:Sucrase/ferredoxin-like protein n=1 Tax=Haloactinopolyspora alba TaxID=648780 RepID=A0A2P8E2L0_9ACTN|nr:sucrase ferredoxin [Haloactinopolyspora alba]PSL03686.1 hypothetical protein CLV30_107167 [Haloactinopolyspora alba]